MKCECGAVEQKKKISKEISAAGMKVWVENIDELVCENCGEICFDGETLLKLERDIKRRERIAA